MIEILTNRFKPIHNSLVEMLQAIDDNNLLLSLFKKAMLVNSLDEFKQLLEKKEGEK